MPHLLYLSDDIVDALRGSGARAWLEGAAVVRNEAGDVFLQLSEGTTLNYVPGRPMDSDPAGPARPEGGKPRSSADGGVRGRRAFAASSRDGGVENLEAGSVVAGGPQAAAEAASDAALPGEAAQGWGSQQAAPEGSQGPEGPPAVHTVPIVKDLPQPATLVFTDEKEGGKCCHYCMNVSYSAGN